MIINNYEIKEFIEDIISAESELITISELEAFGLYRSIMKYKCTKGLRYLKSKNPYIIFRVSFINFDYDLTTKKITNIENGQIYTNLYVKLDNDLLDQNQEIVNYRKYLPLSIYFDSPEFKQKIEAFYLNRVFKVLKRRKERMFLKELRKQKMIKENENKPKKNIIQLLKDYDCFYNKLVVLNDNEGEWVSVYYEGSLIHQSHHFRISHLIDLYDTYELEFLPKSKNIIYLEMTIAENRLMHENGWSITLEELNYDNVEKQLKERIRNV